MDTKDEDILIDVVGKLTQSVIVLLERIEKIELEEIKKLNGDK